MLNAHYRQVTTVSASGLERRKSSDCTSQYQSVNIVSSLVRINRFQVHHMSNYVIFVSDSISTQHIAALSRYVERLSSVVSFYE